MQACSSSACGFAAPWSSPAQGDLSAIRPQMAFGSASPACWLPVLGQTQHRKLSFAVLALTLSCTGPILPPEPRASHCLWLLLDFHLQLVGFFFFSFSLSFCKSIPPHTPHTAAFSLLSTSSSQCCPALWALPENPPGASASCQELRGAAVALSFPKCQRGGVSQVGLSHVCPLTAMAGLGQGGGHEDGRWGKRIS